MMNDCVFVGWYEGNVASMDVMPRRGWTDVAADTSQMDFRRGPAHYVFYSHTADSVKCHMTSECCVQLRNIQDLHMHVRREYIGYERHRNSALLH